MDFLQSSGYQPKRNWGRVMLGVFGLVLLLGAVGVGGYFLLQYRALQKDPNQAAKKITQDAVAAVGKLMVLPDGEQPTVATVTDPTKLGNQNFFAHAKVGDKVLLYSQAKLAILYDPSINKIVAVSTIDLSDQNAPQASGSSVQPQK